MTWQEAVATVIVCAGLFAGVYIAAQRPAFWLTFGGLILQKLWPLISAFVLKRMPPEEEAEWRKAELQGRGDEWRRERILKRLRKQK